MSKQAAKEAAEVDELHKEKKMSLQDLAAAS